MFNNFYDAWWFLEKHPMFEDEYSLSHFLDCLDVHVAKVNPKTCEVDNDNASNTKVEIWLEAGHYDKTRRCHDIDLDCGRDTYEEAIISLANNIEDQYGDSKDRIKPSSLESLDFE